MSRRLCPHRLSATDLDAAAARVFAALGAELRANLRVELLGGADAYELFAPDRLRTDFRGAPNPRCLNDAMFYYGTICAERAPTVHVNHYHVRRDTTQRSILQAVCQLIVDENEPRRYTLVEVPYDMSRLDPLYRETRDAWRELVVRERANVPEPHNDFADANVKNGILVYKKEESAPTLDVSEQPKMVGIVHERHNHFFVPPLIMLCIPFLCCFVMFIVALEAVMYCVVFKNAKFIPNAFNVFLFVGGMRTARQINLARERQ